YLSHRKKVAVERKAPVRGLPPRTVRAAGHCLLAEADLPDVRNGRWQLPSGELSLRWIEKTAPSLSSGHCLFSIAKKEGNRNQNAAGNKVILQIVVGVGL